MSETSIRYNACDGKLTGLKQSTISSHCDTERVCWKRACSTITFKLFKFVIIFPITASVLSSIRLSFHRLIGHAPQYSISPFCTTSFSIAIEKVYSILHRSPSAASGSNTNEAALSRPLATKALKPAKPALSCPVLQVIVCTRGVIPLGCESAVGGNARAGPAAKPVYIDVSLIA